MSISADPGELSAWQMDGQTDGQTSFSFICDLIYGNRSKSHISQNQINDVTHTFIPPLACAAWAGTPLQAPYIIFWLCRWFGECTRPQLPLGLNILISYVEAK